MTSSDNAGIRPPYPNPPVGSSVGRPFAGLKLRSPVVAVAAPTRSPFDGLRLSVTPAPVTPVLAPDLGAAVQRAVRAITDIERLGRSDDPLPHQQVALDKARHALDTIRPEAARDLVSAFAGDHALVDDAARGRTTAAIRAMQLEQEVRANPELRADRFVTAWQQLRARRDKLSGWQNEDTKKAVEQRMSTMGKELARDPQVESLLRKRSKELGIPGHDERRLSQSIPDWLSHSRDRGIGR